jgi:tetratricopeptide (TPR) repeat protein
MTVASDTDALMQKLSAAEGLFAAGDVAAACAQAEALTRRARARGDAALLVRVLLLSAEALHLQARNEGAHAAAIEAIALVRGDADAHHRLRAVMVLASIGCETGDLARAAKQAREGIDLAVRTGALEATLRLLHSLAQILVAGDEYEEAIRCLAQALTRHAQRPDGLPDHQRRCATELALTRVRFGEHLAAAGQPAKARQQWDAARAGWSAALLVASDHRGDALHALANSVELQAWWHDDKGARTSAAASMRLARRFAAAPRYRARALEAVATLHLHAGRVGHAIVQEQRRLRLLRQMNFAAGIEHALQRLAAMQAGLGHYGDALRWQEQAAAARVTTQRDHRVLRQHMMRLERMTNEQRARTHESLQHGERLQVLARLFGQIMRALKAPVQRVHDNLRQAQASLQTPAPLPTAAGTQADLRIQLQQVVSAVDAAAALVQQLKLFSYRSAPKLSVLSLERALREAWVGLGLHQPLTGWKLSMQPQPVGADESVTFDAEADAQRLGILLKLLLMGMTSLGARPPEPRALLASVVCSEPGTTSLVVSLEPGYAMAEPERWGASLCTELAVEMGGRLTPSGNGASPRSFELLLPSVGDLT